MSGPALETRELCVGYGFGKRLTPILHDVSISVEHGESLAIVGESGSGKSTLAKALVGQLSPISGRVLLDGVDFSQLSRTERMAARRRVQLVPQDPYGSLDPRMTIGQTLTEALDPRRMSLAKHRDQVAELLRTVALEPAMAERQPHEFSGGQRQRIAIARALAIEPSVLLADEVTSSLDASVQAGVLELLRDLQRERGITIAFITHDLEIARYLCGNVVVLNRGQVVEAGSIDVLRDPQDPYTRLLIDSVPDPNGTFLTT